MLYNVAYGVYITTHTLLSSIIVSYILYLQLYIIIIYILILCTLYYTVYYTIFVSIIGTFFPPLQGRGGKMGSSDPNSAVFLTDTPKQV